ncbi:GLPGLI family protein [Aquimarina sp. RZ0]|uniref:GLPGLI family protein n=1 Tax=Aquimarina sp. RZ0 TaxID=2607730 RepID=UPI0011F22485|nr:GLPGLI family protein [Aquimarina sp. RZ0]KAA1240372.1 GLPGLI family protein [Aquimarina sp. RZ0]
MRFYIFLFFISATTLFAQQNNGFLVYHTIVNNSNGTSFASEYELYFGSEVSLYIKRGSAKMIKGKKTKEELRNGTVIRNEVQILKPKKENFYFSNFKTKELVFRETVAQELYTIRDSVNEILWKLKNEFKTVGDYKCQKATTSYRGRNYVAWFTSDIPVSYGPWKLQGLPGLILEASDSRGQYEFKASKMNLGITSEFMKTKLKLPDDVKKTKEMPIYIEALKNESEDILARARATLPKGARIVEDEDCDECPKRYHMAKEIYN